MDIIQSKFNSGIIKAIIPNIFIVLKLEQNKVILSNRTDTASIAYENNEQITIRHDQPLRATIINSSQIL